MEWIVIIMFAIVIIIIFFLLFFLVPLRHLTPCRNSDYHLPTQPRLWLIRLVLSHIYHR